MNIAATQYNLVNRALEIYLSGCNFHCKGCHNPELWDFSIGEELTTEIFSKLANKILEHDSMINEIWILGGEPLHQDPLSFRVLCESLFAGLNGTGKQLVLFTGFNLTNIPSWCFRIFDKIKYGRYDENLRTDGELASSNQGWWIK
jgi:anaerobic ribonucleoside-triphosphate reductase activating protein